MPTVETSPGKVESRHLDSYGQGAMWGFVAWAVAATVAFAVPLWQLGTYSLKADLFSHALLIPVVSAYLIWTRRDPTPLPWSRGTRWAAVPAVLALMLLGFYWLFWQPRGPLPPNDYLSVMTAAYLLVVLSGALACLGWGVVKALSFPILFLVFMIPWPTVMIDAIEIGLQFASAEAAHGLLHVTGVPLLRDGLRSAAGITLEVAQECSGVRSSYVLFITSVLGAHMLLRTRWRRWVLVLAVIPLGIVRNGFRILTIAMLCVYVDPAMIDSPIHHRGGPIFFVLSLIPFFLLLLWLRKSEGKAGKTPTPVGVEVTRLKPQQSLLTSSPTRPGDW
ncbi:MAG: exosortase [Verrucomicrobiales bacterium]|nr:exosortase [Verrucomicrobiales bacterium]